jgi:hypothetical protein
MALVVVLAYTKEMLTCLGPALDRLVPVDPQAHTTTTPSARAGNGFNLRIGEIRWPLKGV